MGKVKKSLTYLTPFFFFFVFSAAQLNSSFRQFLVVFVLPFRFTSFLVKLVQFPCANYTFYHFIKYWILRHGKSIPNDTGVIVSSLENGILEKYQLAPEGVHQAQLAGDLFLKQLNDNNIPLDNVRICYSPFSRTTYTANGVASRLTLPFHSSSQCKVVEDLRERYFGPTFELMSHDKYADIWALDEKDPLMPPVGGESVAHVATRLTSAISLMDSQFQGCAILIVSHGDPLQILQTMVNAAADTQDTESSSGCEDLRSRLEAVQTAAVLSQHRNYALSTGELHRLI